MTIAAKPVPVLAVGQHTYAAGFLGAVESEFWKVEGEVSAEVKTAETAVANFIKHDAFPFVATNLKNVALDEVKMVEQYAVQAVEEVLPDVGELFTTPGKFWGTLTAVVDSTASKALAAGISVAQADAQVAEVSVVHAAMSAIQNKMATYQASHS